jgi:hypothetical protein
MTALAVKQNSAFRVSETAIPVPLHSKRMGSHFASKAMGARSRKCKIGF